MKTGSSVNEYGTGVSEHICDTCGNTYTVCPEVFEPEADEGGLFSNCMGKDCDSYDPAHDLDAAFESDAEIKKRDVVGIGALRLRRTNNRNPQ